MLAYSRLLDVVREVKMVPRTMSALYLVQGLAWLIHLACQLDLFIKRTKQSWRSVHKQ